MADDAALKTPLTRDADLIRDADYNTLAVVRPSYNRGPQLAAAVDEAIRRVNAHDELVAALRTLADDDNFGTGRMFVYHASVTEFCRAALAKLGESA